MIRLGNQKGRLLDAFINEPTKLFSSVELHSIANQKDIDWDLSGDSPHGAIRQVIRRLRKKLKDQIGAEDFPFLAAKNVTESYRFLSKPQLSDLRETPHNFGRLKISKDLSMVFWKGRFVHLGMREIQVIFLVAKGRTYGAHRDVIEALYSDVSFELGSKKKNKYHKNRVLKIRKKFREVDPQFDNLNYKKGYDVYVFDF